MQIVALQDLVDLDVTVSREYADILLRHARRIQARDGGAAEIIERHLAVNARSFGGLLPRRSESIGGPRLAFAGPAHRTDVEPFRVELSFEHRGNRNLQNLRLVAVPTSLALVDA